MPNKASDQEYLKGKFVNSYKGQKILKLGDNMLSLIL